MDARLIAVASLALLGCALVVTPQSDFAEHCRFAGRDDTDCGACLAQRCQPEIDACCDDSWCGGLIVAVEECAQKSDTRCTEVHSASTGSGARSDLAACLSTMCRGVCEAAPPTTSSHCEETKFSSGTACACSPGTAQLPSNGFQCSAALFPDTRCCAAPSWPAVGNECRCLVVDCGPSSDGCACSLTDALDPQRMSECRGKVCCQSDRVCRCGSTPCDGASEKTVELCNVGTTPCTERGVAIAGCTLP